MFIQTNRFLKIMIACLLFPFNRSLLFFSLCSRSTINNHLLSKPKDRQRLILQIWFGQLRYKQAWREVQFDFKCDWLKYKTETDKVNIMWWMEIFWSETDFPPKLIVKAVWQMYFYWHVTAAKGLGDLLIIKMITTIYSIILQFNSLPKCDFLNE